MVTNAGDDMTKESESLKAELLALVDSFSVAGQGCQVKSKQLKQKTPIGLRKDEALLEADYQAGKSIAFGQCAKQLRELAERL